MRVVGEVNINEAIKMIKGKVGEKAVNAAINKSFSDVANQIEVDVRRRVPNDTGRLLQSWKVQSSNLQMQAGFDTPYASYQERGMRRDRSRRIRNRPAGGETLFLAKTMQENFKSYMGLIIKRINEL
jgi:IS30 family transposase